MYICVCVSVAMSISMCLCLVIYRQVHIGDVKRKKDRVKELVAKWIAGLYDDHGGAGGYSDGSGGGSSGGGGGGEEYDVELEGRIPSERFGIDPARL